MENIEEELIKIAVEETQKEIDFSIMSDILIKEMNWIQVVLTLDVFLENKDEIFKWLEYNCSGPYHFNAGYFIFSKHQDAEWFILRWT